MTTLGEIGVLIGAEVNEAGFTRAVNAIGGIDTAAKAAASGASASLAQIAAAGEAAGGALDKSAQRITDSAGRVRDGFGKFVPAAQLAAEAAGNVGGSLGNLSDVAGRASASINSGLVASFAKFDAAIKPLEAGLGRLGQGLQDVGGSLTTSVTLPLGLLGAASLKSAGDIQALEKGFAATYNGSEQLGEALAKVQELAKLPGLGLEEALQGATNLQAAGFSADLARRALGAFGNALATVGKGKADLDGVGLALGQIASKGKISAEEINQLAERVPQIRKAMQAAFGTADTEVLQKLSISATDFVEGVTRELEKLPKVTGGINNAFENFADAGTISLSKLGGALNRTFDVEGILGKLADAVTSAATAFERLDPSTQKLIFGVAAAAAAVGPLLFGFGAIVSAIPPVIAGLETLGLASVAALGPIAAVAAAVVAAGVLIVSNWDDIVSYFASSGEGGRVFDDLATSVTNAVAQISSAFASLNGGGNLGDLVSAAGILKAAFRDVAVGITAVSNVVGGAVGAIVALLKGDLSGAADQASRAFLGLAQPIANVLGFQLRLGETGDVVRKGFEGAAYGGGVFGDELLHLSGLLPGFNSQLQGFAGGLPKFGENIAAQSGLLETLRKRLEAVKDAREKETKAAAVAADNKLIDSLQKQIDALLGVNTKGVTDALTKLRENLRDNGNASRALGADYDYNGNRAKILEAGIKSLTDAGFAPGGRVVQEYVRQLREVPKAIEQIQGRVAKGTESIVPDFKLELPELAGPPQQLDFDYGGLFGKAAQDVLAGGGQVSDAFEEANQKISEKRAKQLDGQRAFNTAFEDTIRDLSANIGPLIADVAGLFGNALGSIATGQAGALDALTVLFGGILQTVAGFMSDFGKQLVVIGIGKDTLEKLFSAPGTGPLAVAAGLGLIALAGVVGAVGRNAAASVSSISSGGSAGASLGRQPSGNYASPTTANQQPLKIVAEFKLKGTDLVAVGKVLGYRTLQTQG